jgi:restriction system protein
MTVKFPNSATLEAAVLSAIREFGGVAKTSDIDEFVIKALELTQEQISQIRTGNRTEIQYRLAWVRTKTKNRGLIEKTPNNHWKLVENSL